MAAKLCAYLNYGGNCEQAFRFYEQHLGGKITAMMHFSDMPAGVPRPAGREGEQGVMHARLALGGTELLASDAPIGTYQPMQSAYLSLSVESDAEAERIYGLLQEGGEVFMPLQETFFASRFAMLRDRFGTSWMLARERAAPAA